MKRRAFIKTITKAAAAAAAAPVIFPVIQKQVQSQVLPTYWTQTSRVTVCVDEGYLNYVANTDGIYSQLMAAGKMFDTPPTAIDKILQEIFGAAK